MDKIQELADVLLTNGMIPRYKADGTLDEKGRNYRFEYEGEVLEAKKRDDVYPALEKCPKIQEYFLNKLKAGETEAVKYDSPEEDEDDYDNMSEEDFLKSLEKDETTELNNEAEETETFGVDE